VDPSKQEFEDDTEAVKALIAAAQIGPVRFDHVVAHMRRERREQEARARAVQDLTDAGVRVVDDSSWDQNLECLTDADGNDLDEATHCSCPGHAATLEWAEPGEDDEGEGSWVAVAVCTDPAGHGHRSRYGRSFGASTETTGTGADTGADTGAEAEAAAAEAKRAERRKVIASNKKWRAAEEVRREWLRQLYGRKTPPKGAHRYVLGELARADWRLTSKISGGHTLACELLGLSQGRETLEEAMSKASDGRAQVIALALVLSAYEDHTSVETWRRSTSEDREYLSRLIEWGYEPSDIEAGVLGNAENTDDGGDA
jgi:ParB family transcriptional regulator, chromosome partitioning protein